MLWLKFIVLKWLLQTLPFDYVEDAFYRAVVLEKDEQRATAMWYMVYKLWYKHPMNVHIKELRKRVYGTTEKKKTGGHQD